MFYNVSNHPMEKWSEKQFKATIELGNGRAQDIPFPNVPPKMDGKEVSELAVKLINENLKNITEDDVVMIQGETSLTYWLIHLLRDVRHVKPIVVVATSERKTIDNGDGTKTVKFEFVQFRQL